METHGITVYMKKNLGELNTSSCFQCSSSVVELHCDTLFFDTRLQPMFWDLLIKNDEIFSQRSKKKC